MIKRLLQFIIALIIATVLLVFFVIISPYLAMELAWNIATGNGVKYEE